MFCGQTIPRTRLDPGRNVESIKKTDEEQQANIDPLRRMSLPWNA
jgi:hypothetical protein